jgi:L-fuculose-phosphate aldolase
MIKKDLLGLMHGSISIKKSVDTFIINKKNAIFNNIDSKSLMSLNISQHTLWGKASITTPVHSAIYEHITSAKFITCLYPVNTIVYSLQNTHIRPIDYLGAIHYKEIPIYDPKNIFDWDKRAPSEIISFMKKNSLTAMVIKGVGICAYNRDINELIKEVSIIDTSCKILLLNQK